MRHPLNAIKEVCTQTYSNALKHKNRNTWKEHRKKRLAEKVHLSDNVSSWLGFIICDSVFHSLGFIARLGFKRETKELLCI